MVLRTEHQNWGRSIKQRRPSHLITKHGLIVLCGNQLLTKTLVNLHNGALAVKRDATYSQYLLLSCLPSLFIFHYHVLSKILSDEHYKDSIHTERLFSKTQGCFCLVFSFFLFKANSLETFTKLWFNFLITHFHLFSQILWSWIYTAGLDAQVQFNPTTIFFSTSASSPARRTLAPIPGVCCVK